MSSLSNAVLKKIVDEIEPKEAFTEIEKQNMIHDYVILDVRTPNEYAKEHLENANNINVKFPVILKMNWIKLDKNKKYIVYCKAGVNEAVIAVVLNEKT